MREKSRGTGQTTARKATPLKPWRKPGFAPLSRELPICSRLLTTTIMTAFVRIAWIDRLPANT